MVAGLMFAAVPVASPVAALQDPPLVVMVVGDPFALGSGDAAVQDRLEALGFDVDVVDDTGVDASAATGASTVLVTSSVSSHAVGDTFRDVQQPVWVAKPWSLDDMAMTGTTANTDYGTVKSAVVTVAEPAHPLAAGLGGDVAITSSAKTMSYGEPGGGATIVTTAAGRPSTFFYPAGAELADGSLAAGCRLHSSLFQNAPAGFTANGWALFDAAAAYAASGCEDGGGGPVAATRIVLVSADGLRPDAVQALGASELPHLHRLLAEGATTSNARTMFDSTRTLPNHTSIVTGVPVLGPSGHGVTFNEDDGSTVHDVAGRYVPSMFDVAHDAGLSTSLFAGKPKFDFLDRSWDAANGAPDVTGGDDGADKIDHYERGGGAAVTAAWTAAMATSPYDLSMIHYAAPDAAGHAFGWDSPEYDDALREVDGHVGEILAAIDGDAALAGTTYLVFSADHGGAGTEHGDPTLVMNATIPLFVWGGQAAPGTDLYALNVGGRLDPGASIPDHDASPQPIRNADAANLVLDLLGLGPIPGSTINALQDLEIAGGSPPDVPPSVTLTAPVDGATVSGVTPVVATATDDLGIVDVEFLVNGVSLAVDTDGTDGWSVTWDTAGGPDGTASVTATATDTIGQRASDEVTVTVANGVPDTVVMVVSDPEGLTSGDAAVHDHLIAGGYGVTLVDDATATGADAVSAAFVFVASSVSSHAVGDAFAEVSQPVWVAKPWSLDDMGMTGTSPGTDYGTTRSASVSVADPAHPLAAGMTGEVAVTSSARTMSFGVPAGGAVTVLTANGLPSTFVYAGGADLADGSVAAGCRLHSPAFTTAVLAWTPQAWALFDAAAAYAAGGCG